MSVSPRRRSDAPGAEAVWRDFHARLLGFIARRVPDRGSAEDILQEVMLRIHGHAGELERSSAVGAWVYQIARNAIVDHYRRASVRRERPSGIDLDHEEPLVLQDAPKEVRGELATCLGPLLDRLPELQREALTLTELEGLTQASAAAQLGVSTSGMKSRVQRGRKQLRQLLERCCAFALDARGAPISCAIRPGADLPPGCCVPQGRSDGPGTVACVPTMPRPRSAPDPRGFRAAGCS